MELVLRTTHRQATIALRSRLIKQLKKKKIYLENEAKQKILIYGYKLEINPEEIMQVLQVKNPAQWNKSRPVSIVVCFNLDACRSFSKFFSFFFFFQCD